MAVKASCSVTVASITDVVSTTRYYLLQSSTLTAPAKPTASPPGGSWQVTEPTYSEGSTNSLYTCDETVFSDGTWAYSSVSLSTSYEAAKAAYNKAAAAAAAAADTDNHFWNDTDGAHVSSTGDHDLSGANLLLTSARLAFRNALSELFSIVVSGTTATISFFSGIATIVSRTWTYGTTTYTGITIQSPDGVEMECDSPYEGETTKICVEKTSPSGEEGGCVYLGGKWVYPKDPSITTTDEGYGAHMSSLIALIVGADVHTVAGVDVVTLEKRIADAIQPVVLYNGGAALDYDTAPGAGTTDTVTLSETAANFRELTISYQYDVWARSSVTLTNPSGKTAGLYLMFVGADGSLWTKTRNVSISGTSITNATNAANLAFSLANGACLLAQSLSTPEIIIDRVEGRR